MTQFAPSRQLAASRLRGGSDAGTDRRMDIRESPLDDPRAAAHAWARYRRIMRWMMLVTVTLVVGSLIVLYRHNGMVSIHLYIAAALGIGVTMLLASALMGLMFLSSGTGHDSSVTDPFEGDHPR